VDAKIPLDTIIIRAIQPNEIDELLTLCERHALYEKANFSYKGKRESLKKHLFQNTPLYNNSYII
jgi:hypothetical protein